MWINSCAAHDHAAGVSGILRWSARRRSINPTARGDTHQLGHVAMAVLGILLFEGRPNLRALLGNHRTLWLRQKEYFERSHPTFTLLFVDNHGVSGSGLPAGTYALYLMAADVLHLLSGSFSIRSFGLRLCKYPESFSTHLSCEHFLSSPHSMSPSSTVLLVSSAHPLLSS